MINTNLDYGVWRNQLHVSQEGHAAECVSICTCVEGNCYVSQADHSRVQVESWNHLS